MVVGFTGTERGMTELQRVAVIRLVDSINRNLFVSATHGDCSGSDEEFHNIVLERTKARIHIFPGVDDKGESPHRAYCEGPPNRIRLHDPAPYLVRDKTIAFESDILIATPHEMAMINRSGTWTTVRRFIEKFHVMRINGIPTALHCYLPDGSLWL